MHITLTPMRREDRLTLVRHGDTLVINGAVLDLSVVPEGACLPAAAVDCDWIAPGPVIERRGGMLHLTLILPHGPRAGHEARFPAPITLTGDGLVSLPDTHPEELPQ